jgi:hypothetical protein
MAEHSSILTGVVSLGKAEAWKNETSVKRPKKVIN